MVKYSVEVKGVEAKAGEGIPRRHICSPDELVKFPEGVTNLWENFLHGWKVSKEGNCAGHRPIDSSGHAFPYVWQTYDQVKRRIENMGSGLRKIGLQPEGIIGIYSVNKPEWIITEYACYLHSFVHCPLYDTLGEDAITFIIQQTELSFAVCSPDKVDNLIRLKSQLPTLTHIIVTDDPSEDLLQKVRDAGYEAHTCKGVEALGAEDPVAPRGAKAEDLCCINYTSGTTGRPKGAELTQGNQLAVVASLVKLGEKGHFPVVNGEDVYISYLPLCHVFERSAMALMLYYGVQVGFYQGDTQKLLDDIGVLKPTIFVSVPRLFNRIYDKVLAGVRAKSALAQFLFKHAFEAKKKGIASGRVDHWLWDWLVFSAVRSRLGGRCRFIVSGAAPISPDVKDFLRICFSAHVLEGYGQTENGGAITFTDIKDPESGSVGGPETCTEVKLVDVAEMNYTSQDKPLPRGEICMRGPAMMRRYYKEPEKTAEVIDADGWLHTGDIGMWDESGRLVIIDRIKNIFKLSQGEYIAPEKIEGVYQKHELIAQAFVHGSSLKSELVGVFVPDPETLPKWAHENGLLGKSVEDLCREPKLKQHLLKTANKLAKEEGLKGFELVRNVHLHPDMFSIENDLLTPTFKLKRQQAKDFFKEEIERMYSELEASG
ncbi:uncharacterized protein VTP21DRAFT_11296 [Calcarisporiella thermophila]|uniref:uncharacterized protein n=1 Tax=Calcarisporiella thermophila TaxID=911321 RepID=UPI003742D97A